MTIRYLTIFLAVAEYGTMSAAAKAALSFSADGQSGNP